MVIILLLDAGPIAKVDWILGDPLAIGVSLKVHDDDRNLFAAFAATIRIAVRVFDLLFEPAKTNICARGHRGVNPGGAHISTCQHDLVRVPVGPIGRQPAQDDEVDVSVLVAQLEIRAVVADGHRTSGDVAEATFRDQHGGLAGAEVIKRGRVVEQHAGFGEGFQRRRVVQAIGCGHEWAAVPFRVPSGLVIGDVAFRRRRAGLGGGLRDECAAEIRQKAIVFTIPVVVTGDEQTQSDQKRNQLEKFGVHGWLLL